MGVGCPEEGSEGRTVHTGTVTGPIRDGGLNRSQRVVPPRQVGRPRCPGVRGVDLGHVEGRRLQQQVARGLLHVPQALLSSAHLLGG